MRHITGIQLPPMSSPVDETLSVGLMFHWELSISMVEENCSKPVAVSIATSNISWRPGETTIL